jgi:hypothetical protein
MFTTITVSISSAPSARMTRALGAGIVDFRFPKNEEFSGKVIRNKNKNVWKGCDPMV